MSLRGLVDDTVRFERHVGADEDNLIQMVQLQHMLQVMSG